MTPVPVALRINGESHEVRVEPSRTLLEVLRGDLGLTGTKENCLEAECGVCTVLLDGDAVNSCILLAVQCAGREVITIEGLARGESLDPLQQAFVEQGAVQCGYCIPGMILTARAFLDECPEPDEAAIRDALAGNLCRCTGYQKIVAAVAAAAGEAGRRRRAHDLPAAGRRAGRRPAEPVP